MEIGEQFDIHGRSYYMVKKTSFDILVAAVSPLEIFAGTEKIGPRKGPRIRPRMR